MIFSKGFVYRLGIRIKERGERMAHIRVFGVHILSWCCGPVIALGLAIKNSVMNCPVADFSGKK